MTKPATLEKCFALLRQVLNEQELQDLRELSYDNLWQAHMQLGPRVRELLLEDNSALEQRLESTAFCCDSDVTHHIITAFWDDLVSQEA